MSERDYVAADDLTAFLAEKDAVCGEVQTLPSGRVVTCTKPRGHLAHSAPGCVWEHPGYTRARSERDAALAMVERVRALADRATACLSIPPADCTDNCGVGPCDCSGVFRARAWDVSPDALRAILDGSGDE